jgi:hypothetical protein
VGRGESLMMCREGRCVFGKFEPKYYLEGKENKRETEQLIEMETNNEERKRGREIVEEGGIF